MRPTARSGGRELALSSLEADAVDGAVATLGVGAKRSDGKLPPHVTAYLTMALCLFGEDDYTEVAGLVFLLGARRGAVVIAGAAGTVADHERGCGGAAGRGVVGGAGRGGAA